MEPLRAPIRKAPPVADSQRGLTALAIGLAVALAGLIYFVGHHGAPVEVGSIQDPSAAPSPLPETVYVYRCTDGSIQARPCETAAAPPTHELPSLMVYEAPHYRDDPRSQALIDEADARYDREVAAAKGQRSEYETTIAVTGSAQCVEIRRERDSINAAMRQPYGNAQGEWYRDRLRANRAAGIKFGCWTGTPSPR